MTVNRRDGQLWVVTYHPRFGRRALGEIYQIDPEFRTLERLDDDSRLIQLSDPSLDLVAAFTKKMPVFVQHIAPVQVIEELAGVPEDLDRIVDAAHRARPLREGATFAVQCRRGKKRAAGEREARAYSSKDVEVRVGRSFEQTGRRPEFDRPEQVVSIYVNGGRAHVGVSDAAGNLRVQADEHRRYSRWPKHVSRAEYKLREALEVFDIEVRPGWQALDVGAAPGGWTRVLAERGAKVTAVDPGALVPEVLAMPGVRHLPVLLDHADLGDEVFDLVANDMNMDGTESAALMCQAAPFVRPGAAGVMTIKLTDMRVERALGETARVLDHAYLVRGIRHLFHNRQEVTAFLERRTEICPGWERSLPKRLPDGSAGTPGDGGAE